MERRTADRFSTGKRPEAFWQYDAARPELLRARDVPGDHAEATFAFEAEMALLQARTAYLAEHGLLEPHELANIQHPHPRQDGALHPWDEAALAGLRQALPTP